MELGREWISEERHQASPAFRYRRYVQVLLQVSAQPHDLTKEGEIQRPSTIRTKQKLQYGFRDIKSAELLAVKEQRISDGQEMDAVNRKASCLIYGPNQKIEKQLT